MDDVKAPPLVRTQGAEHEVGSDALQAEAVAALVEEAVHLIDLLAEEFDQLGSAHGIPVELIGPRKTGSRCPAWQVTEGKRRHLQHPLEGRTAVAGRTAAFEPFREDAAGAAEGEDEMLDQLLRGPETVVLKRVHLAPLDRRAGELGTPEVEDLLQDRMHRMAVGGRSCFVGTISPKGSGAEAAIPGDFGNADPGQRPAGNKGAEPVSACCSGVNLALASG